MGSPALLSDDRQAFVDNLRAALAASDSLKDGGREFALASSWDARYRQLTESLGMGG